MHLTAADTCKNAEDQKIAILLQTIGEKGLKLLNTINTVKIPKQPLSGECSLNSGSIAILGKKIRF